jgi:hypothetical protein
MAALVGAGFEEPQLLLTVLSTDGNIRFTAAYLRDLADIRTSRNAPHTDDLSADDQAIIYGAYREGFQGYGGVPGFQAAVTPGYYGQLYLFWYSHSPY